MKFIISIAFFVIGANALREFDPNEVDFNNERSVNSFIANTIEDISLTMKDIGMDPWYIQKKTRNYTLPVPVIFNHAYFIEEFLSNGLSNIVLHSANYNVILSRLNFDIEFPLINGSVESASTETMVFGKTYKTNSSGRIEVQSLRFVGEVRFSLNIAKGIYVSVRSAKVDFNMGGIDAAVKLFVKGKDYSEKMNNLLNTYIPETFKEYSAEINELLGIMLKDIANEYFKAQRN